MAQYKTGTVTVTNGDATVTGSGTLWVAEIDVGDWFSLQGQGNVEYQVLSVTSDTALELTTTYAGITAVSQLYSINRDFTVVHGVPILSEGDVDTHRVMARLATVIDAAIQTDVTTASVVTTGETPTVINSLSVAVGSAITFTLRIHGIEAATGDVYSAALSGAIKNISGVTSLVTGANSSDLYIDPGASNWFVEATANDVSDMLDVIVTGESGKEIVWTLIPSITILGSNSDWANLLNGGSY